MDLNNFTVMSRLTRQMEWLQERQQVLARNIANSDTPGFRAADLTPLDFSGEMKSVGMAAARTSANHIVGTIDRQGSRNARRVETQEVAPNGNGVELEQEMIKASETALDYRTATNLYQRAVGLLTIAVTARG